MVGGYHVEETFFFCPACEMKEDNARRQRKERKEQFSNAFVVLELEQLKQWRAAELKAFSVEKTAARMLEWVEIRREALTIQSATLTNAERKAQRSTP